MFFARVGKDAVVNTALLPVMTVGVKVRHGACGAQARARSPQGASGVAATPIACSPRQLTPPPIACLAWPLQKAAQNSGLDALGDAPLAVLAPAMGVLFKAVKGLVPL